MNLRGLKNIGLSLAIMGILSALLLYEPGRPDKKEPKVRIATFKFSSRLTLDETERGCIDGLAARGYADGGKLILSRYNSENDLPTANTIASEIVSNRYDMVITISTPSLQVMANANKAGKVTHVFGTVTDPFASGVGLDRNNPSNRPAHLAGMGTFQPVEKAFLIAREMNPALQKVGTVWCRNETCSEACVKIARTVCDSLGIELLEATVDNSNSVLEAAQSLVSRGAEVLWIGGDNTVEIAAAMVIKAALEGGIPVFTNNTDHPPMGALFGLGANYYEVGLQVGNMAADILDGAHPAEIPVNNVVPEKLLINGTTLQSLGKGWQLTEALKERADSIL